VDDHFTISTRHICASWLLYFSDEDEDEDEAFYQEMLEILPEFRLHHTSAPLTTRKKY